MTKTITVYQSTVADFLTEDVDVYAIHLSRTGADEAIMARVNDNNKAVVTQLIGKVQSGASVNVSAKRLDLNQVDFSAGAIQLSIGGKCGDSIPVPDGVDSLTVSNSNCSTRLVIMGRMPNSIQVDCLNGGDAQLAYIDATATALEGSNPPTSYFLQNHNLREAAVKWLINFFHSQPEEVDLSALNIDITGSDNAAPDAEDLARIADITVRGGSVSHN